MKLKATLETWPLKYPGGTKRVNVAPIGIVAEAISCRTGATDDPAKLVFMVREINVTELLGRIPAEIGPEDTPTDAVESASVCIVMPVALPAVAAPIVRPFRVMVKAVFAAMPETAVVMTMEVAPGTAEVAVMVTTEVVPAALGQGALVGAKNADG